MSMTRTLRAMALVAAIGFAGQAVGGWNFGFTEGEGYAEGASPTNYNGAAGAIGEWSAGTNDASIVTNETLVLDTGSEPLTWTPDDASTTTGKIVTIQQDVTFVAVPDGEDPPGTTGSQTGVYLQEEIDGEITTNVLYGLVSSGWQTLSAAGLSVTNHSTHTVKFVIDYSAEPDATVSFYVGETLMTIGSGSDTSAALNVAATAMSAVTLQGSGTIDNFSGSYGSSHTHSYVTNYYWAADNSTCTATNACECGVGTTTETVETTYEVTIPPTVDEYGEGTYTADFVNFPDQTKKVQLNKLPITVNISGNKGSATVGGVVPEAYYSGDEVVVTPSNGYVIAQISIDGTAVAGTLGLASFTTNLTADGLTATFAKKDAWWVAPGLFKKLNRTDGFLDGSENLSQFGFSEAKGYLGASRAPGSSSAQVVMYQIADLNAATPDTPAYVSKSVVNKQYFDGTNMANRSVTFVGDYLVGGNILATVGWSQGFQLPVGGVPFTWQDSDNGVVKMIASDGVGLTFMYEAPDGSVYATTYKGTKLGRYTLGGTTLTLDTAWGTAGYVTLPNGSYGVVGAVVNGQTNVYVCTDSQGVFVVNAGAATPAATLLLARTVTGRTQNMRITGTADNTPRLIVTDAGASDAIKVFDLAADGMSLLTTTPVATHAVAPLGGQASSGYSPITGTDDDMYGYLGNSTSAGVGPYLITLRHTDYCPTTATQTVGANGSSTVKSATIYVYPDVNNSVTYTAAAGYRIASLTNNSTGIPAAVGATSYELENIATGDAIVVSFELIPFSISQSIVGDATSSVEEEITMVAAGGSFDATYTATNGWISSVYTNGAPAYDCSGSPTQVVFSLTGIACDIDIVVASSAERPDTDAWYVNPGLTADFAQVGASTSDGCAGFHWGLDGTDDFLAAPIHFTGQNSTLYSVKSLEAGSSSALGTYTANTLFSADVRGAAVSKPLNVHLVGSALNVGYILSLPLNTAAYGPNTNAFKIWTSNGTVPDAMDFTADGQHLYADAYNPTTGQNYIYKYRVLDGLKSSGTNLVLDATWTVGIRVRDMTVARIGGKDIVYINANSALYVLDTSSSENTAQSLGVSAGSNYANLTVAGIGAGSPHLYVFRGDTGALAVYTIKGDYTVETTPFKSYTGAELGAICGYATVGAGGTGAAVAVTDDEATLFLGANVTGLPDRMLVIRSVPVSYPDWILNCGLEGEDLAAMQGKYDTWAAWQTVTDLMTTDYSAQFLMNADAEAVVALTITNITLSAQGNVTLAIEGTADAVTLDLADINGVLYLSTATDLAGSWTGKTFGTVPSNIGIDGIAVPVFGGANGFFFRAEVGYAAPAGSTELTAPDE